MSIAGPILPSPYFAIPKQQGFIPGFSPIMPPLSSSYPQFAPFKPGVDQFSLSSMPISPVVPNGISLTPTAKPTPNPVTQANQPGVPANISIVEQFQLNRTKPTIKLTQDKMTYVKAKLYMMKMMHPHEFQKLVEASKTAPAQEGLYETIYMYDRIKKALSPTNQGQLEKLLNKDILLNRKSEDGHSTLYHLYAMLTTPRAADPVAKSHGSGYNPSELVNETVDFLNRPEAITQKFAPLSPDASQKILMVRNSPKSYSDAERVMPPAKFLEKEDLDVNDNSGTCVSSSVMHYMATREPSELVRHLNELTSPLNAFYEKVRLEEINPGNPAEALKTLQENKIRPIFTGPGEILIKVGLPAAGVIRAMDSQYAPFDHRYRNAIESAYQSALTFLADYTYDPATDMMDDGSGNGTKGLIEQKKSLIETIIKENGGVQSVTYQAVDNKLNPAPGEENNCYLYGYARTFENTTNDILRSLAMKEPVVVGTTDTDETGAIVTGHEVTIDAAFRDKKDGQLKFIIADSDDQNPELLVETAQKFIPTIHHAGMPLKLASQINQEIDHTPGIMVPDFNDAQNYQLLRQQTGPMPSEMPQPQQVSAPVTSPLPTQPTLYNPALFNPVGKPLANLPIPTAYPMPLMPQFPQSTFNSVGFNNPFAVNQRPIAVSA